MQLRLTETGRLEDIVNNGQNYDDIIHLPHFEPKKHKRMSLTERAAQFGAFRALSGHEEAISETARYTDYEPYLNENKIELLNEKLKCIQEKVNEKPLVTIQWFVSDEKKAGGSYKIIKGSVKKIDMYAKTVVMADGEIIPIERICEIESPIFLK